MVQLKGASPRKPGHLGLGPGLERPALGQILSHRFDPLIDVVRRAGNRPRRYPDSGDRLSFQIEHAAFDRGIVRRSFNNLSFPARNDSA